MKRRLYLRTILGILIGFAGLSIAAEHKPSLNEVAKYISNPGTADDFLNRYWPSGSHKAFACSDDGPYGWWHGAQTPADARSRAMFACEKYRKPDQAPCKLVNVNGVWEKHAILSDKNVEQANAARLTSALALMQAHADTADGNYYSLRPIYEEIGRAMGAGGFKELEKLMGAWNDPRQRLLDGNWRLLALQRALESSFRNTDKRASHLAWVEKWKQSTPGSTWAALAEAEYWEHLAFDARGHGYAKTVAPEGWELFAERIVKAQKILDSSKPYASNNPIWYVHYLKIARLLNWDMPKIIEIFQEAISKHRSYYPIYGELLITLMPRWGGSYEIVDWFIHQSVAETRGEEGEILYAYLYAELSKHEGNEFDLFQNSLASWPLMKRSFEDWMKRYPKSYWNMNRFASFACRAKDKETFLNLRTRIGEKLIQEAWPANLSLDVCHQRFMERT